MLKTFQGTMSGYRNLHAWVSKKLGKPQQCEVCKITGKRRYHWANISKEYKKDLTDWKRLCVSCHNKFDGKTKDYCLRGHKMEGSNIMYKKGERHQCRECNKIYMRAYNIGYYKKKKLSKKGEDDVLKAAKKAAGLDNE